MAFKFAYNNEMFGTYLNPNSFIKIEEQDKINYKNPFFYPKEPEQEINKVFNIVDSLDSTELYKTSTFSETIQDFSEKIYSTIKIPNQTDKYLNKLEDSFNIFLKPLNIKENLKISDSFDIT